MRRVSLLLPGLLLVSSASLIPRAEAAPPAEQLVEEALRREIYGMQADRDRLLTAAAEATPGDERVQWHRGFVRHEGRWVHVDELVGSAGESLRLAGYERQRESAEDTAAGQFALANWCRQQKLAPQERAHLSRVLELDPNHLAARSRLGFVATGNGWMLREELNAATEQAQRNVRAIHQWRGKLRGIAKKLESDHPDRRQHAASVVKQLANKDNLIALEAVLSTTGERSAQATVEALDNVPGQEAVDSLVRHAVFAAWDSVRLAAAVALRGRSVESYAPQLVGALRTPVISRMQVTRSPDGRLLYRHVFERETQDRKEVLVLDTQYIRESLGGSGIGAFERAVNAIGNQAAQNEAVAAQQSLATRMLNTRIIEALNSSTGENAGFQAEDWWQWWNDHNEIYVSADSQKEVLAYRVAQSETISDPVVASVGGGSSDCLIAGTPIWTSQGMRAVDEIRVGDLVFSQSPDTGELALKPVIGTSHRPRGPLTLVRVGDDEFSSSGGHLYWASGHGWVRSRRLKSGMMLHTTSGVAPVREVVPEGEAETYNLVVADFHTYFVGSGRVLSHDNTIRKSTAAVVPGLIEE